ncbi:lysophospholipid acyltransferase family protein [Thalassomonas sp. M1454]|uniref:lysophospholipid acyltransferase family protein n=1 Tax=Thalassomonas sp. M1454 TaxID=2594477 RepID=UPI0021B0C41C|nr:lysophospholipid acyltransferase family protein [Thalassomonas sp. M1454]
MMQPITEIPDKLPRTNSKLSAWLAQKILKLSGWKVVGELPNEAKVIMAVAPHTSNWDFILGILVKFSFNLKVSFLGKSSIFIWPFSLWLKSVGGIAVDRSNAHGVVGQIVNEFNNQSQLILGIAPEGTRSKVTKWKTGFLQIAQQANIPVVPVQLDFKHKQVMFFTKRMVSTDIDKELADIQSLFSPHCAKKPQNF